ncbi:putative nonproteinogenic amino acid hydroxylase [Allokutzneria sp. A3M-2-11 16]|uniref:putative nonproteinogenic amino acid hydroxylase n=1 Tax=Allokutzneria sp. A3M-2-11 16 TaxID=2962043 RepID=UPI0020B80EF3|nr:putative nonproteinogenic amino acid hydroxylase [Allokutzneria sp. A3M-2-11 16]MCP3803367.1 putative nonproteinogenic amino acid hydroxylase [Allokutzneria sp. A3M-2-11 16]
MLKSTRLGAVPVDDYDLAPDLAVIDSVEPEPMYDEFTYGAWSSLVLANGSGSGSDNEFRPHDGGLRPTELGARLPAVMRLVTDHFDTDRLQWARIFVLSDGILAPHVDFLEFDEPGTRVQVPLRTTEESLHSEDGTVYHLRRGEVWSIHTTSPHSARSLTGPARLSLCLDFGGSGHDVCAPGVVLAQPEQPVRIFDLPPLPEAERARLLGLSSVMRADTLRDVFQSFAAAHFVSDLSAAGSYDLFIEAAELTGDPELAEKARAYKTYCIEKRAFGQRFEW